jgi:hypothetical protein
VQNERQEARPPAQVHAPHRLQHGADAAMNGSSCQASIFNLLLNAIRDSRNPSWVPKCLLTVGAGNLETTKCLA